MRRRFLSNQKHFDPSNYMTIEALEDGFYVSFRRDIEYNRNGEGWKTLKAGFISPVLNKGEFISFRLTLEKGEVIGQISSNYKLVNLRGNMLSIVFGDNIVSTLEGYESVFHQCFYEWKILDIEKNFLPATTLARDCYSYMFGGCNKLTTAPELPATTLTYACYQNMFYNCSSLTTAPELPATTLTDWCYSCMFTGCGKLNYIKMLATDISASNCLRNWVTSVSSTGTFVKNPNATWEVYGINGIPEGWTVKFDGEEENNNFEFPMYIEADEVEDMMLWTNYTNYGNFSNLITYLQSVIKIHGNEGDTYYALADLEPYRIEIYLQINDGWAKVNYLSFDKGDNCIYGTHDLPGAFNGVTIWDNNINWESDQLLS